MGAVMSCIQGIGDCIMTVIRAIAGVIMSIVNGVVAVLSAIVRFLTCEYPPSQKPSIYSLENNRLTKLLYRRLLR